MIFKLIITVLIFLMVGCTSSWLTIPDSGYNLDDLNRPPIMIIPGELEYPYLAAKVKIEGAIIVDLNIDESGNVTNVKIIDRQFNCTAVLRNDGTTVTVKKLFDDLTIRFYKNSKFSPAQNEGKPIPSTFRTGMNFLLIK